MLKKLSVYGTIVIVGTLVLLGGSVYSQNVPAPGDPAGSPRKLWSRKCKQVTETPTPSKPLDGCKRVGWDCMGGCAVGGTVRYNKCVLGLGTCNEREITVTVSVPHVPCIPIEGVGGAGCKCDSSREPVDGPVTLYLLGC